MTSNGAMSVGATELTTTIKGNAISELCLQRAGMLNFDIYDTPRASLPAELRPYWDINKSAWKELWLVSGADGYRCALYAPKAKPGQDPKSLCPPVLVFRGSDVEASDFAEMAMTLQVSGNAFVDRPWPAANQDIPFPPVNTTFSPSPTFNGKKAGDMKRSGLHEEVMFTNVSGTERINVAVAYWGDAEIRINWNVSASLFYGMQGDWAVNFAQGLGKFPKQYENAIRDGKRAAAEAAKNWNKRLIITGHSLGGGLASAAAIAARVAYPGLIMKGETYYAAGLHANTAKAAKGTLATAGAVPIRAQHVKDEILNSLQSKSMLVPFLAHLLKWAHKTMPGAVPSPIHAAGFSPGPLAFGGQSLTYAPKFGKFPILYTIDRQTLVANHRMSKMAGIVSIADNSNTINAFVAGLVRFLINRISGGGGLTKSQADELQGIGATMPSADALKAMMAAAFPLGAPLPTFNLGNSPYLNTTVEPFVNRLVDDAIVLGRILMASGIYHTFVPCAFTFLLDKKK